MDNETAEVAGQKAAVLETAGIRDAAILETAGVRNADVLRTAGTREADALEAAGKRDAAVLATQGQREINVIWEETQRKVALSITFAASGIAAILAVFGKWLGSPDLQLAAIVFLYGAANLVIGFYFGRTNHTRTGGVGGGVVKEDR